MRLQNQPRLHEIFNDFTVEQQTPLERPLEIAIAVGGDEGSVARVGFQDPHD